jgi:hypothetical protein
MSSHEEMVRHAAESPDHLDVSHVAEGHGATRFEGTDAKAGIVIWSLGIIAGTLVFVFAITIYIQRFLYNANPQGDLPSPLSRERVVPPPPQIEVHPWDDLPRLRAHENEVLKGTVKAADGRQSIPIDRAMEDVVPRLSVRPEAPTGISTFGGEGRQFGGSQNANRTPYRIEIKGEADKRAK